MNWHQQEAAGVLAHFNTSSEGLSAPEAARRLAAGSPNKLPEKKSASALRVLVDQFRDVMIGVLAAAALVSGFLGDLADTVIILLIILLNAVIGFFQQYRAEQTLAALRALAAPGCLVRRGGAVVAIDAEAVVPGDILLLEAGNTVAADARLLEVHALQVQEAALTGESLPVWKHTRPLPEAALPTGGQANMVFRGTQVTAGRAVGLVVATGAGTELGRIAGLLQTESGPTPLQRRMAAFGKKLSRLILLVCALLFVLGLLRGEAPLPMLLLALSLAVAAIPEALPALIAVSLARGAGRLARNKALVRRLSAVETLGSVTCICTDKTGTLTQNEMTVVDIAPEAGVNGHDGLPSLLELAMMLNHTVRRDEGAWVGDPTEVALLKAVEAAHGVAVLEAMTLRYPKVAELPFDPERKRMTTVHRDDDGYLVLTKGAAESVWRAQPGERREPGQLAQAEALAGTGVRVLAFACARLDRLPDELTVEGLEKDLRYLGIAGMIDPPRPGVRAAVQQCLAAGIRPVMITGDHSATAVAIARAVGLPEGGLVLTGAELDTLSDVAFERIAPDVQVYARVSPEQKFRIVAALQRGGQLVAMTGDGVNDAPALRKADIGIAMGITGTDVSKEAAAMVLLDDNFTSIVAAVREGRRIYDNIRKFVQYIMTCNGAEIGTIFLVPLLGLPVPLLPVQLLWINLITDGLPALALAAESADADVMRRPPRPPDESVFAGFVFHIVWVGLLMAAVTLATQTLAIRFASGHWQTMVFTVLSFSQLGHALAIHAGQPMRPRVWAWSNPLLLGSLLLTVVLHLLVVYLPAGQRFFHTQPLSAGELALCFGLSMIVFAVVEVEKFLRRRGSQRASASVLHYR